MLTRDKTYFKCDWLMSTIMCKICLTLSCFRFQVSLFCNKKNTVMFVVMVYTHFVFLRCYCQPTWRTDITIQNVCILDHPIQVQQGCARGLTFGDRYEDRDLRFRHRDRGSCVRQPVRDETGPRLLIPRPRPFIPRPRPKP